MNNQTLPKACGGHYVRRLTAVALALLLAALLAAPAAADVFELSILNDTFDGTESPDVIRTLAGDDLVHGLGKRDRIYGTLDHDDLYGGEGRDWIFGGHDNDYIVGDNGEDQLSGGDGNDVIVAGNDKLADEVVCGPGEDIAYLSGPDNSSLAHDCEQIETFKSFEKITNPEGVAGSSPH